MNSVPPWVPDCPLSSAPGACRISRGIFAWPPWARLAFPGLPGVAESHSALHWGALPGVASPGAPSVCWTDCPQAVSPGSSFPVVIPPAGLPGVPPTSPAPPRPPGPGTAHRGGAHSKRRPGREPCWAGVLRTLWPEIDPRLGTLSTPVPQCARPHQGNEEAWIWPLVFLLTQPFSSRRRCGREGFLPGLVN